MSTSYVLSLPDTTATNDLVACLPPSCTFGTGALTAGTERRRMLGGTIHRLEVFTASVAGGVLEIWDVAAPSEGAESNIDQQNFITDAYLQSEKNLGQAKLIYTQQVAGSAGAQKYGFATPTTIARGLAARWKEGGGDGCLLNLTVDGTFAKMPIAGV